MITDRLGRRLTMLYFSLVALIGILLQTAAQDVAVRGIRRLLDLTNSDKPHQMFTVARIVLGFGTGVEGIAAGVYLNETFPSRWRTWGVGTLNNFY